MQTTHSRNAPTVNGSVKGRGLALRSVADRLALGVDLATGVKRLDPSLGQIADACRVTSAQLREAIKARTNGNGTPSLDTMVQLKAIVSEVGISETVNLLSAIEVERRTYGLEG
jgi:hypothetical protein